MSERDALEALFRKHGYHNFTWIKPESIVVSQWVRLKCLFGCPTYGKNASCPPNTPSVSECRSFFSEYSQAVLFHFTKTVERPEDRHSWSREINRNLLALEREVFLAGYEKVLLLFMDSCSLCADCAAVRTQCKVPRSARPAPEAMAVDVFATVRQYGLPIDVLSDFSQPMNRYAFLMIE